MMSRLSVHSTSNGLTVEICPHAWFKPFATLILLLAVFPSWVFIAKIATREYKGYASTLSPATLASHSLLKADACFVIVTTLGVLIGVFLIYSYIARETLTIRGGQLSIQRATSRWAKIQHFSFDLREIENVHLAHVGRGFPPALGFTYREKKYYAAKRLSTPDTARVVELLREAVETSKRV